MPGRLVLLGHPVSQSLSPSFQNAALADAGLPLRYEALDVEPSRFESVLAELHAEGVAGNVTAPFKERTHDACDRLTPLAERVGAVNVFWVEADGALVGDNSDVGGFDATARTMVGGAPRDLSVGVLGASGAAAAVLAAVEQWPGCIAHVYNRTPERARQLAERFSSFAQPVDDAGVVAGADLLVNATSVGLRDDSMPIDPATVALGTRVVDLVYRREETRFVHALRARGLRACDGLEMLIEQGAIAFTRWFGIAPNRAVMWEAVRR
ncbi:MAG TPA: shikimate dehydrogenase [Gemmatimonadaceae bacterium]|nr:shikimate dehydrogenase [Gemmatimonadaceae bacterium]